jgi:magnesium chelatase subunit D
MVTGARGRHVRSVTTRVGAVDVLATVRAAALHDPSRIQPQDVRFKLRAAPARALSVFVVDASGSMAARRRMALAKGAVLRLLLRAYQTREEVALIAFRATAADVLLPPTSSVHLASTRLRELPTGGRTPLALALRTTTRLLHHSSVRHASRGQRVVLISDGRANVPLAQQGDAFQDALAEARQLRAAGVDCVLLDTEDGPLRLQRAATLADELGASYLQLRNP